MQDTEPGDFESHRRKVKWDPTINMGHVLTGLTSIVASFLFVGAAWFTVNSRLLVLEEARLSQNQMATFRQEQVNDKFQDVKDSLNELKISVERLRQEVSTDQKRNHEK